MNLLTSTALPEGSFHWPRAYQGPSVRTLFDEPAGWEGTLITPFHAYDQIKAARTVYPKAQLGVLGWPQFKPVHQADDLLAETAEASRIKSVVSLVDMVCPDCRLPAAGHFDTWMGPQIDTARRLAKGKPVIPIVSHRRRCPGPQHYQEIGLTTITLLVQFLESMRIDTVILVTDEVPWMMEQSFMDPSAGGTIDEQAAFLIRQAQKAYPCLVHVDEIESYHLNEVMMAATAFQGAINLLPPRRQRRNRAVTASVDPPPPASADLPPHPTTEAI